MADLEAHKRALAEYGFTDAHGHPLENCAEFVDLLAEIERLRAEHEALRKVAKRGVKALEGHDEWYLEDLRDDLIAVLLATAALEGGR